MKLKSFVLTAFAFATILNPINASAILITDKYKSRNDLLSNTCVTQNDIQRLWIKPYKTGYQADIRTSQDLAELLSKIYGCDIRKEELKNNPNNDKQDGIVYLIFGNQGVTKAGKQITLFDLLEKYSPESSLPISKKTVLYPTIDDLIESEDGVFKHMCEKYGKENIFIQAIDIINKKSAGLYTADRKLIE